MTPNDVIEPYVVDVMRRVPSKDRNEVGLELRGLLTEMLEDRAKAAGRAADDPMVLDVLRAFGTSRDCRALPPIIRHADHPHRTHSLVCDRIDNRHRPAVDTDPSVGV